MARIFPPPGPGRPGRPGRVARHGNARLLALLLALVVAAGGCGDGDDDDPPPAPTPTPTQTTSGGLRGLIVVHRDVNAGANEAAAPPANWAPEGDKTVFDKALSRADWTIEGASGITAGDGVFDASGLAPGRYTLEVRKVLDGNLVPLRIPVVVGDSGPSDILVEVGPGVTRTRLEYTDAGATVVEIYGPYGNRAVFRDGRLVELSDGARTLTDSDGDGRFEIPNCAAADLWTCPDDRNCSREPLDERFCHCISSCPYCDNCELPGVCATAGSGPLYRCADDGSCAQPGDRCVCVPSCPDCRDCAQRVCARSCDPVEITAIRIDGRSQMVVGREGPVYATADFSDGSKMDVTALASWASADESVATVGSWGLVRALAVGRTTLTAKLGATQSRPFDLEVVERPTLQRIQITNSSCYCGPVYYRGGVADEPAKEPAEGATEPASGDGAPVVPPCYLYDALPRPGILPPGSCRQVVVSGGQIQFRAIGEYADGSVEDITETASWYIEPAQVGDVEKGLFTAQVPGEARIIASVGNLLSDPTDVRVVDKPSVESLSIYPGDWAYPAVARPPVADAAAEPCFDCGVALTLLSGDSVGFHATAHYDTGDWGDVTDQVTWRTSNDTVATIAAGGKMAALQAGNATVDATLGSVISNPVGVRVVNEATLLGLGMYQEGTDRVVSIGDQRFFRATGSYDVGFTRDVTEQATWRSGDDSIGGFEKPGVFVAKKAGRLKVWAELGGLRTEPISLEVYETTEIAYCDPNAVNRDTWSDDFNRVVLESDCGTYAPGGLVTLRYTVTETRPHGGIFDPCLDLYVYQGDRRIRTIREQGCGEPFLPSATPGRDEAALKYQLQALWDLHDESGAEVPPGRYTIYGRFYLYYDPVVDVDVVVLGDDKRIPCEVNECGNGCGYVHSCGDAAPPGACPAVCTRLCECPPGWGITADGNCQACTGECCPPGAACPPGVAPCEPLPPPPACCPLGEKCDAGLPPCPLECCPANARCTPDVPPCPIPCCNPGEVCPADVAICEPKCCPPGAACDGEGLVACDCCPEGSSCPAGVPPCPLKCCPPNARCTADIPPCVQPCCAAGETCPDGVAACVPVPVPTPTPGPDVPEPDGLCYLGTERCDSGSYHRTLQARCCDLYRFGAGPAALSWCPFEALDATGNCTRCAASPCDGLMLPASGGA